MNQGQEQGVRRAVQVLIADDEDPLRSALSELVTLEPGLELAAVAADADEAIALARDVQPDVALLDARMPGGGGPRAAREIARVSPRTRSIGLSAYDDRANVLEMLSAGAIGYIVKGMPSAEIVEAILRAGRGQSSLPVGILAKLFSEPGALPDWAAELAEAPVGRAAAAVRERAGDPAARRTVLSRIVAAGEEERRQIAASIHDDSIQVMTAAGMRLQILRKSLDSPEQLRRLDDLEETIQLSIVRLRRLIFELRPPTLDLEGLGAALRLYVDEAIAETGAAYDVEDASALEPSEETRVVLYRIAQEVLANVRKHAAAEHVKITISDRRGGHLVRIVDDGVGFRPDELTRSSGGLAAVRGRAELAGGRLEVVSAPGAGTSVEFWLPAGALAAEDGELVA